MVFVSAIPFLSPVYPNKMHSSQPYHIAFDENRLFLGEWIRLDPEEVMGLEYSWSSRGYISTVSLSLSFSLPIEFCFLEVEPRKRTLLSTFESLALPLLSVPSHRVLSCMSLNDPPPPPQHLGESFWFINCLVSRDLK